MANIPHDSNNMPDFADNSCILDPSNIKRGHGGRGRKGVHEYAAEYHEDFTSQIILQRGMHVNVLVCRFCAVMIGARSDRIKEHLSSKRHAKQKADVIGSGGFSSGGAGTSGRNLGCYNDRGASSSSFTFNPSPSVDQGFLQSIGGIRESGLFSDMSMFGGDLESHHQQSWSPAASASATSSFANVKDGEVDEDDDDDDEEQVEVEVELPEEDQGAQTPSPPIPALKEQDTMRYHLKWETHAKIFRKSFISFQAKELLTDVMLVSGSNMIKCHKVVLSACSDYFVNIFKEHPLNFPVTIILNRKIFSQLKALVHFMYHGEVIVRKQELKPLLKAVEELGIWGLTPRRAPPPVAEGEAFVGNVQGDVLGEVVDMSKPKQVENLKHDLIAKTLSGETATSLATPNKITHEPCIIPALLPIGPPSGSMVGLNSCVGFINSGSGINGLADMGPIPGPSTAPASTSTWIGSGNDGNNVTLVNDGILMVAGTVVENQQPAASRKRKYRQGILETLRQAQPSASSFILPSLKDLDTYESVKDYVQTLPGFGISAKKLGREARNARGSSSDGSGSDKVNLTQRQPGSGILQTDFNYNGTGGFCYANNGSGNGGGEDKYDNRSGGSDDSDGKPVA